MTQNKGPGWPAAIALLVAAVFAYNKFTERGQTQTAGTRTPAPPAHKATPKPKPSPLPTPAEDPKAEVAAFYDDVIARRYDNAYDRLSSSFQQTMSREVFVRGFETTTSLRYTILGETGPDVRLFFASFDAKKPGIRTMVRGQWKLVPKSDGSRWLLDEGDLKAVDYAYNTPSPTDAPGSVAPPEEAPSDYDTPAPDYVPAQPPPPVVGSTCDDETISEVERDGKVVATIEGSVYLVNDLDVPTTSIWLGTDDIKACSDDDKHYSLIDGSDVVSATKVQP